MSQVKIVVGYLASWKSTVTKELTKKGAVTLNRDTEDGTIVSLQYVDQAEFFR